MTRTTSVPTTTPSRLPAHVARLLGRADAEADDDRQARPFAQRRRVAARFRQRRLALPVTPVTET